jgi:hypothetical protein
VQPLAQPAGHAGSRRHVFVPVSNAMTGATSAFGAPSFRYWSRNGAGSRAGSEPGSLSKRIAPSALPSWISCPWCHGPITRNTLSFAVSFGSIAL